MTSLDVTSSVVDRAKECVIGTIDQIPPGEGRTFEVHGRRVAVFRTRADTVFATQALCPHREGPLADGMLGQSVVICPLHDRSFDLATGRELGGDCHLATYQVRRSPEGTLTLTVP